MKINKNVFRIIVSAVILLLMVFAVSALFVYYSWRNSESDLHYHVKNFVQLAANQVPLEELKKLNAIPEDTLKPEYRVIKSYLKSIIKVDTEATFSYLIKLRSDELYFVSDSESETSPDYSPAGQHYYEANTDFYKVFKTGESLITGVIKDRWGSWRSILIPVKDKSSGEIIAVLGMDYKEETYHFLDFPWFLTAAGFINFLLLFSLVIVLLKQKKILENELYEKKLVEKQLRKLNIQKDKFFSIISHDLRSPFQGLLGYSGILADEKGNLSQEEFKSLSQNLHNLTKRIFTLLNNLLDWANMQSGNFDFNPSAISLHELVDNNANLSYEVLCLKEISFINNIPEKIMVFVDEKMIDSVFRNLIINAVKFSYRGSTITVKAELQENNFVEVSIADKGIGMSKETLEGLFNINEKSGRLGTEGEESTGLGLYLCKEFTEKNGGSLYVHSEEGNGSTFYFTLPLVVKQ